MSRAARPAARDISRRFWRHETGSAQSPEEIAAAIEQGFQRLRNVLGEVVGQIGFDALLVRAAHLTKNQGGLFEAVTIETGTTAAFDVKGFVEQVGAQWLLEGATLLLANLIDLLCIFIGEVLALRLIARALPDESRDGTCSQLGKGGG